MRLNRGESRERTRCSLLDAARRLVTRGGFDATSISDIAEAAGFTKGAFFSNFDSKEALLLELLRSHKAEHVEAMRCLLIEAEGRTDDPSSSRYLQRLEDNSHWILLDVELQVQASRSPTFAASYASMNQTARRAIGAVLAEVFACNGRQIQGAPEEVAGLLMALVNGLALASAAAADRPPFHGQLKTVVDMLLAAAPPLPAEAAAPG